MYRRILSSRLFILMPLLVIVVAGVDRHSRVQLFLGITIQNIALAACIAWCVAHSTSGLGRVLNSAPLVTLGLMSYSVYLWQQPFFNPVSGSPLTRFPVNLVLLGVTSVASYLLIERPVMMWRPYLETLLLRSSIPLLSARSGARITPSQ